MKAAVNHVRIINEKIDALAKPPATSRIFSASLSRAPEISKNLATISSEAISSIADQLADSVAS